MSVNHAAINTQDAVDTVDAVLRGGPADMPHEARACQVTPDQTKVKVAHRGGHEHFERDDQDTAVTTPRVYRWSGRTKFAE